MAGAAISLGYLPESRSFETRQLDRIGALPAEHNAHIAPGREGLFNLIKSLPPTRKYEPGTVVAVGDFVIIHERYSVRLLVQ